jgi:hypothetical protein
MALKASESWTFTLYALALQTAVNGRAALLMKVALGDVFYVKKGDDLSRYRIYTNKIDRKHVDFLLCDSTTMQPLIGIELDDKSHERPDRRERDIFVDGVFAAWNKVIAELVSYSFQAALKELLTQLCLPCGQPRLPHQSLTEA